MGDGDVFDSLAVEVLFEFLHWHGELLSNAAFGLTVGPVQASAGKLYHLCAWAKSCSTGILPGPDRGAAAPRDGEMRPYRAELELCAPMGDAPASMPGRHLACQRRLEARAT